MMSKSKVAFLMTANKLFATYPQLYHWTMTFKELREDWWYFYQWTEFIRHVEDKFGRCLQGVRVAEVSPRGHGLHFHALINKRVSIHILKRLGKRFGITGFWVERADSKEHPSYLAKYMTKDASPLIAGARRWATFGGFHGVKTGNIRVSSQLTHNIRQIQTACKIRQIGYGGFKHIARQTQLHGKFSNWPIQQFNVGTSTGIRLAYVKPRIAKRVPNPF